MTLIRFYTYPVRIICITIILQIPLAQGICTVKRTNHLKPIIPEGAVIRLNSEDVSSPCFQICSCGTNPDVLGHSDKSANCTANQCLIGSSRCAITTDGWGWGGETFYVESVVSATQGLCTCYFGQLVCSQPDPDSYTLSPGGIYLFLGFSKEDEALLSPLTGLRASSILTALQTLIDPDATEAGNKFLNPFDPKDNQLSQLRGMNKHKCQLSNVKLSDGNIIITSLKDKHKHRNDTNTSLLTDQELSELKQRIKESSGKIPYVTYDSITFLHIKAHCHPVLKKISDLVNQQSPLMRHHPLLSILKVGEVTELSHALGKGSGSVELNLGLNAFSSVFLYFGGIFSIKITSAM